MSNPFSDQNSPNPFGGAPNPYASPQTPASPLGQPYAGGPVLATQGARFANALIDGIALYVVHQMLGFILIRTANLSPMAGGTFAILMLINMSITIAYYIAMESSTGQTLGKMVTGTKVVNETGGPPSFGQVLGRTFARLIPFEAFSFLFGSITRGWHDSLPGTYVIKTR